jgi:hypothetical protein
MLTQALLMAVAVLNLIPGAVAFSPRHAEKLYGLKIDGPALELAMRHRAVLLSLVGVLLVLAAIDPAWLDAALLLAFASKGSFLVLYALTGRHGQQMRRVAIADTIALLALTVVVVLSGR